ncbi:hypothetical protein HPB47_009891, partial [Ixodes persulcatus]
ATIVHEGEPQLEEEENTDLRTLATWRRRGGGEVQQEAVSEGMAGPPLGEATGAVPPSCMKVSLNSKRKRTQIYGLWRLGGGVAAVKYNKKRDERLMGYKATGTSPVVSALVLQTEFLSSGDCGAKTRDESTKMPMLLSDRWAVDLKQKVVSALVLQTEFLSSGDCGAKTRDESTKMPMLLSDRWAVDLKQKQELDEIRRKVAADFGETFPPPPPAPSVCPRGGLLPCPRYTLDDLMGVRVEVGQKPGQRRVFLAGGGSARHNGVASDELEVVVNATGDRSRTVRIREPAVPRRCLVCKAQANKRCPVCKVFYCSAKCQLDDWPSHQTTCGVQKGQSSPLQQRTTADEKRGATQAHPCGQVGLSQSVERQTPGPVKTKLPSPKPAAPLARPELPRAVQLEPASLPMDESVEVTVCYGTDLSELFLQRASSLPALSELQARLQAVCFTGGAYRPSPGAACAAQFEDDGQWYRARVATLRDGRCTVYFVDYGNSADVAAVQTCPLPEGCAELPEQAVRCGLYGVRPKGGGGWGEGATLELATLMQGRLTARACRVAGGKHEVELRAHDGPSLSEVLVAKGLAESTLASPPAAPAARRLASVLGLAKPGEALMLQVTASKEGRVWVLVAHPGATTQLLEVEQELNERCPKMAEGASPARGVSSGDYVASQSLEDGRWYRACVTRATPAGHTVRYVDYGNEEVNTRVVPLDESHLKVGAASARLDAKDATSLPLGATLSFTVGAAAGDNAMLHGQLVCEDDQKVLGAATLSPWDSGLGGEAPAAPLAAPKAAAKADKVDSTPKPVEPVEEVKPPPSVVQPLLPEPRVLDVPVRPLPAAKRRMQAVWRTQDVLFLHQEDQEEQLAAMMAQLNAWVGQASPPAPASRLAKGDYVCALFSQDETWYRGQVGKVPLFGIARCSRRGSGVGFMAAWAGLQRRGTPRLFVVDRLGCLAAPRTRAIAISVCRSHVVPHRTADSHDRPNRDFHPQTVSQVTGSSPIPVIRASSADARTDKVKRLFHSRIFGERLT